MTDVALTAAQRAALTWLDKRGGDGVFDRFGVALAQGETAPVERKTWNALRDQGLIEFYDGRASGGTGYGRLRVVKRGR